LSDPSSDDTSMVDEPRVPEAESASPALTDDGAPRLSGTVKEVLQVSNYTYLRLEDQNGGVWVAVTSAPIEVGTSVTVRSDTVLSNFESKALGRTFDEIHFGSLDTGSASGGTLPPGHPPTGSRSGGAAQELPPSHPPIGDSDALPDGHPPIGQGPFGGAPPATAEIERPAPALSRASGENGRTIAELFAQKATLSGAEIRVHARVMKATEVGGMTYVHLQDGTGDPIAGTHDLTVVTSARPEVGTNRTFEGSLALEQDIGIGVIYPLLLKEATILD
jgi:hypothetical protein